MRGNLGIRFCGGAILVAGVVATFLSPDCSGGSCPSYALNSAWILRGERGLAVVVVLLVVLTAFWRVIINGEFPSKIGRDSLEWPVAAEGAKEAISALEAAVKSLSDDSERDEQDLQDVAVAVEGLLDEISARLDALEAANPGTH
ncbi:MAG: hypothetical protein ABSC92_18755 [Rhizomicrobium sp.]